MQNRKSGVHSLFECGAPLEELVPEHLSELTEVTEVAEGLVMMMNDDDDDDGGGGSALMMMMMGEEVQKNYIYKLPIVRTLRLLCYNLKEFALCIRMSS